MCSLAHLQSSYPAETQFFSVSAFSENDLRRGSLADVKSLTQQTAKMGVDSPASNTRSKKVVSDKNIDLFHMSCAIFIYFFTIV